jgi:hypothetical protein
MMLMLDINWWSFDVLAETQSMAYFFGAFLLFSLFVFITSRVNFWIRFIGIPFILALSVWGYAELDQILGYAYPGSLPEKAQYLSYTLEAKEDEVGEFWIIVWLRTDDGRTRLYRIEHSEKSEEKLKKANQEGKEKGTKYQLEKRQKGNMEYPDDTFVLHPIKHWNYPDKDGDKTQGVQEIPQAK